MGLNVFTLFVGFGLGSLFAATRAFGLFGMLAVVLRAAFLGLQQAAWLVLGGI
jgi:hypothetical protein